MKRVFIRIIIILIFFIQVCISWGLVRRVSQDGSQAYTDIQTAINASANGDTVLVLPGRYLENVTFNGRSITLASNNILTGISQDIANTILDGNHNGSVISIQNSESFGTIYGFCIINGYGSGFGDSRLGGGIFIHTNSTNLFNIINCNIYDNYALEGGGIGTGFGSLYLKGTSIRNNVAKFQGGGIYIQTGPYSAFPVIFDSNLRCSIYNNYASRGADISNYNRNNIAVIVDTFTVATPWNYFASAHFDHEGVENPYTFDILHTVFEETNHDLYVAPDGDDNNSGLSSAEPMRTIARAVYKIASDSLNPKAVILTPGVYSESLNGQLLPLTLKRSMILTGSSERDTIIDGDAENYLIVGTSYCKENTISNLTLRNGSSGIDSKASDDLKIMNVRLVDCPDLFNGIDIYRNKSTYISDTVVNNCISQEHCPGISIWSNKILARLDNVTVSNCTSQEWLPALDINAENDVIIDRCKFINNHTTSDDSYNAMFQIGYGSPPLPDRLNVKMTNCLFSGNTQTSTLQMGVLQSRNGMSYVENCTFANNTGGSSILVLVGDVTLKNNVFYNLGISSEIYIPNYIYNGTYTNVWLGYNDIRNGQSGVVNDTNDNHLYWLEGNTDTNPGFVGGANTDYLSPDSPLIDTGDPIPDEVLPLFDLAGNARYFDGNNDGIVRLDIGAYEYQPLLGPVNLSADTVVNLVHLSWIMDSGRALTGFRIYRDGIILVDVADPQTMDYIDTDFTHSDTLEYYVVALYGDLESQPSNNVTVILNYVASCDAIAQALTSLRISPNPFCKYASIKLGNSKLQKVKMDLYNIKGQLVKTILNENLKAGESKHYWDGRDENGKYCRAGIYFLRVCTAGSRPISAKLTLIK